MIVTGVETFMFARLSAYSRNKILQQTNIKFTSGS